jgi:hypothetical protein
VPYTVIPPNENLCSNYESCVSRRWRHLWENLYVFNFSDDSNEDDNDPKMFTRFAFFVNAVLFLRRTRHIRKFHLSSGMLETWNMINFAATVSTCGSVLPLIPNLKNYLSGLHTALMTNVCSFPLLF